MTPNKDAMNMSMYGFATLLNALRYKHIDRQGRNAIPEEVNIKKLLNNILYFFQQCIISHLTDDTTFNEKVSKSEE